jgi:hypothetical protein
MISIMKIKYIIYIYPLYLKTDILTVTDFTMLQLLILALESEIWKVLTISKI